MDLDAGMSMGMVHQDLDSSMIMVMAYIVSSNIMRRSLTAGQRAMAYALVYPEPAKLKRKADVSSGNIPDLSKAHISRARAILGNEDLVSQVMSGALSLNVSPTDSFRMARSILSGLRLARMARVPQEAGKSCTCA